VFFPLVVEEKRLVRMLDGGGFLVKVLLADYSGLLVDAFLVRVGRREDTYGDRDASVKVQDASLSESPELLVVATRV